MQGIILTLDKEELESIISRAVETALQSAGIGREETKPADEGMLIMRSPDLCKYLNMKMSTLYQLTHKKEIPFYKKRKMLNFKKEEIDQWLADGKQHTIREQNIVREIRIAQLDKKKKQTIGY
jgi:excisionase family DNA binding protein